MNRAAGAKVVMSALFLAASLASETEYRPDHTLRTDRVRTRNRPETDVPSDARLNPSPALRRPVGGGPDGNIYLGSNRNDAGIDGILRYDVTTGVLDIFVQPGSLGPKGLTFGPDGDLYVCCPDAHSIERYDGQTGEFKDVFVPAGSCGLDEPFSLMFIPDNSPDCNSDGIPDECEPIRGEGNVDPGEECDEDNIVDGDGCDSSCMVELGWTCVDNISVLR